MLRSPFVAADFTAADFMEAEEASMAAADVGPVAADVGTVAGAGGLAVATTAVADIGAAVAGMAAAVDGVGAQPLRVPRWALLRSAPQPMALATSSRTAGTAINMSRNGSGFAEAFAADLSGGFLKRRSFPLEILNEGQELHFSGVSTCRAMRGEDDEFCSLLGVLSLNMTA
jgi:hypothetical protein